MSISVVYIARGQNAGLNSANKFLESYKSFKPGCNHELIVILKGWTKNQDIEKKKLTQNFQEINSKLIELNDDGFDWGAYIRVTKIIKTNYICFLNSFSRPLNDNWLKNFYEAIKIDNVGMCGASSSYKAWRFSLPLFQLNAISLFKYPFRVMKRIKNHLMLLGNYPDHFYPHIRSNGFVVCRENFLDFIMQLSVPKTKIDCYKLESGISSYSYFLIKNKQRLVIVDKKGKIFDVKDWVSSNTYCCPNQPGLCIADNNTDLYDMKNLKEKKDMEFDVWGEVLS